MEILAKYTNGNTDVVLHTDGTKIRTTHSDIAKLDFPESIDLKITDYCDAGCAWCHENSTTKGIHGKLETIRQILRDLPAGVEIAIGGGDPLAHPEIMAILETIVMQGLIPNITVNGLHLEKHAPLIKFLRERKLLRGLGVSYNIKVWFKDMDELIDDNTIMHFIAGIDKPLLVEEFKKVLVLGYKHYGRGLKFFNPKVERNLAFWRWQLAGLAKKSHLCFDNLALEQLQVKDVVSAELWQKYYMGADGEFTMYADAVAKTYAISSTSQRFPMGEKSAREFFYDHSTNSRPNR